MTDSKSYDTTIDSLHPCSKQQFWRSSLKLGVKTTNSWYYMSIQK